MSVQMCGNRQENNKTTSIFYVKRVWNVKKIDICVDEQQRIESTER